jgi:hypothetical protein
MKPISSLFPKNRNPLLEVSIHLGTAMRFVPQEPGGEYVQQEVPLLFLNIKNLADEPIKIDFVEIFINGKLVDANPHYWVHAQPILPQAVHTKEYLWDHLAQGKEPAIRHLYAVVHTNSYQKKKSNQLLPPFL